MKLIIDIPRPPTTNKIWRHRTGANGKPQIFLDRRYAIWKRHCDNLCLANRWNKTPVRGHYIAVITLDETRRRGDADNRIKACLDWLKQAGITDDDSLCDSVTARYGYAPDGCRVELSSVEAEKIDDAIALAVERGREALPATDMLA